MKLPEEFKTRMCGMLKEEYAAFEASYDCKSSQALRLNPNKAREDFLKNSPFALEAVPWAKNGYYYKEGSLPGKHPYHAAGVYYIQEPSAMAPAEYLCARPGERVLDLCAAPGGKTTQIAAHMQGKGVLISNEIHPARAKILSENVERMGIGNVIVTNETPKKLSEIFTGYFDKILVDAPCSGEGMFRKNEAACEEWSLSQVQICAQRQDEILSYAAQMLRCGGRIVYSTCTFAPEENEGTVSRFLKRFPEFDICPVKKIDKMTGGNPQWVSGASDKMKDTVRLFPHKLRGEGHYLAVLEKKEGANQNQEIFSMAETGIPEKNLCLFTTFCKENLILKPEGIYLAFGENLYLAPKQTPPLKGLKILRPGLHLGTNKKNRFEPSHALALFLKENEVCRSINYSADSDEIRAYLNGQSISCEGEKGWYVVLADGYSIGWGKLSGGMLKNHYPKGLRRP